MPRVRWTPEEEKRLLDLIAAGKSWTLISGTLKRSMKSVKLHAETLRRTGAKKLGLKAKGKGAAKRTAPIPACLSLSEKLSETVRPKRRSPTMKVLRRRS